MIHSIIEPLEARIAPATLAISAGSLASVDPTSGDKTFVFHVTLTSDTVGRTDPITVNYATNDGVPTATMASAHAGTDYVATSGMLTFAPSSDSTTAPDQTQDISVVVHSHTTATPLESFTVDLTNAAQGSTSTTVNVSPTHATEVIDELGVTGQTVKVAEGNAGATVAYVPITLNKAVPAGFRLDVVYQTVEPANPSNPADGTATSSAGNPSFYDYTAVTNGHASVAAGQTSGYLPVSVVGDRVNEVDETFGVKVLSTTLVSLTDTTATGDVTVTSPNGSGTILNDDAPGHPQVQVTANAATVNEGGAGAHQVSYTVSLTQPVAHSLIVNFDQKEQAPGSPDAHQTSSVTIPAGQTSATLNYTYTGDTAPNHDVTVTETITSITQFNGTPPTINGVTVTADPSHSAASTVVLDDDATVSIADATAVHEGNSGFTTVNFPVTLSQAVDHDVVITYSTVDGTTTSTGSFPDFVPVTNGHVTIAAGHTSANVPVQVIGDTLAGPDENFSVHVTAVTGATLGTATGAVTIQNDDGTSSVSIVGPTGHVSEGGTANFTVQLTHASENDVVLHYSSTGDTRASVTDATVTIPAGALQATLPIAIQTDTANDPQHDFTVTLNSATNATLDQADLSATGTIDPANLPTVTIADASYLEGAAGSSTAHSFTVTLSKAPVNAVDLLVSTVDGTAKAGTDYVAVSNQPVHFDAGATTATVSVQYLGNDTVQTDRVFTLQATLAHPDPTVANAQLGAHSVATATIQDDDSSYSFVATGTTGLNASVTEGTDQFASYTVTRTSGAVDGSVHFATFTGAADTATAGKDYVPVSTTLHFAAGQISQTVLVPIIDDTRHENTETFSVNLTGATNGILASTTAGQVSIADNDPLPMIHVTSPVAIKEGNSGTTDLVFNVTLDRANDVLLDSTTDPTGTAAVKVDFSTIDSFHVTTPISGTLIFKPNGALQQQIIVQVPGNTEQNALPIETFKVQLANAHGATLDTDPAQQYGTGTVIDDDHAPVVSVLPTASVAQGGQESFTVSLSNASAVPIQVSYYTTDGAGVLGAKSGHDFTGNDAAHLQTVTFAPGQTTQTIAINTTAPASDPVAGPNETFQLHLQKVASVPTSDQVALGVKPLAVSLNTHAALATGTIVNNTSEVISLVNDAQVTRGVTGDQLATFTVSLLHPSTVPVTVAYGTADGTATVGAGDYSAVSGTLLFKPGGAQTQTISVPIHGSMAHEDNETFSVQLTAAKNASIGRATSVGTIVSGSNAVTLDLKPATATSNVVMEGGTVDFIPTLSSAATQDVTFTVSTAALAGLSNVARANIDYVPLSKTFTIHAGKTTPDVVTGDNGHFTVQTKSVGVFQPLEQFSVVASNVTNAVAGHTRVLATIENQDVTVSGRVARWTDLDGDIVTLAVSQGTLNSNLFSFTTPSAIGGRTLSTFDIFQGGQQFLRTNITVTATPQKIAPVGAQGDGSVSIGSIIANNGQNNLQLQGFDLGRVSIAGNLDQIFAGDLFNDAGITSLHVQSFGKSFGANSGSFVAEGIGSLVVDGDFSGSLLVSGAQFGTIGTLSIGGALKGISGIGGSGTIQLTGKLASAKIGSIVGTNAASSATIEAGSIGAISVLGNIDNTAVADNVNSPVGTTSTIFSDSNIASVTVGGSILGGSIRAQGSIASVVVTHDLTSGGLDTTGKAIAGVISAGGLTTNLALNKVVIHGSVNNGKILAGYQNSGAGLSADAQIALVQIDGNATALDVVAGALAGADGVYGGKFVQVADPNNPTQTITQFSSDDAKVTGGIDSSTTYSRIARVIIGGSVIDNGTIHGIVAQEVDAVSVGGTALALNGGPNVNVPFGGTNDLYVHEIAIP